MGRGALLSVMMLYRADQTIFDNMALPTDITKADLVNKLLIDCAELEVIYPDPEMMKASLEYWSKAHLHSWEIEYAALYKDDYDPFTDFDRNEDYSDSYSESPGSTVTAYQRAFDSGSNVESGHTTASGSNTGWHVHNLHQYGNSALGTNQDIIKKEIEIREKYNMVDIIIADFKKDFCLCVY